MKESGSGWCSFRESKGNESSLYGVLANLADRSWLGASCCFSSLPGFLGHPAQPPSPQQSFSKGICFVLKALDETLIHFILRAILQGRNNYHPRIALLIGKLSLRKAVTHQS